MIAFRVLDAALPRAEFDCGIPDMNAWFRTHAGQQHRRDSTRTHVGLRKPGDNIAAFYSLNAHRIELEQAATVPEFSSRKYPIPSILISRLAVDRRYQGQGIGALTLADALGVCATASVDIGVEVVVVDAIDHDAAAFYMRHGFAPLTTNGRRLYITTRNLRAATLRDSS
jgi:GNAT superfamily N-acetyltransferase